MADGEIVIKSPFCWEVNIDSFKNKKIGDYLISPKFSINCPDKCMSRWKLALYPKGHKKEAKGYMSLFLHNVDENDFTVTYSLSLLNQNNLQVHKQKVLTLEVKSNVGNGFPKYVAESLIMGSKSNLLKDNKLRILCSVIVENKTECNIEIENKQPSKRIKFLDDYEQLLTNKDFSDVTVQAGDKSFYLHKCILTTRSIVFERMFKNDMKEKNLNIVKIEDIKSDVLEEFFQFLYTGKVTHKAKNIMCELLSAADKYCVENLKTLCQEKMCNNLSDDNAIDYLNLAITNHAELLQLGAINYIVLHIDDFIETPEFDEFAIQHPNSLLKIMKLTRNV